MAENDATRGGGLAELARYEIRERIGEGATSVVYRAWDRELARPVALKVLRHAGAFRGSAHDRFRREAEALAAISHPNVVQVHDVGERDGEIYLVLELVEGRSLAAILAERALPPATLAEMVEKAARGVGAAHEKGIVHRDMKPANVLVGADGAVKVTDFGLARREKTAHGLTGTGTLLGTPLYMAPEQVTGAGGTSPATDVYALGAILYEALVGCPPHTAANLEILFLKILREDPIPPRKVDGRIGRALEAIALKALEKRPARRYPDAAAFAEDLRRHREGEPVSARPPGWPRRAARWVRRRPAVSTTFVLAAALALSVAGVRRVESARERARMEELLRKASDARDEGRFPEARNLYAQVSDLSPGHPVAVPGYYEMDAAAKRAERRREAGSLVAEARSAREEALRLEVEVAGLSRELAELSVGVPPSAGADRKRPIWDLERRLEKKMEEAAARRSDVAVHLASALKVDPESIEARRELAGFHFEQMVRAEESGDEERRAASEKLVLLFDDGAFAQQLARWGTVSLATDPPGAKVELFHYLERHDRRLDLDPYRSIGADPSGPIALPCGSYLVVLDLEGYRPVRLPILVSRGSSQSLRVPLYTDSEIGEDFVYVPPGPFLAGGDREAYLGEPLRHEVELPGFFVARHETTMGEYLEFLNAVAAGKGAAEAQKRVPRSAPRTGWYWEIPEGARETALPRGLEPRIPVYGVSRADAELYAVWKTHEAESRGEKVSYRLPSDLEWEKAARGVDGRPFPWGHHFDWTFTNGGESRAESADPVPAGATPADESPYGVLDLAGNVCEWCGTWRDETANLSYIRGGAWSFALPALFRSASRSWGDAHSVGTSLGFRLVRVLE